MKKNPKSMISKKAFELKGKSDTVILLIHGFTGTPAIMIPLAKKLHKNTKHTIKAIKLTGHGTSIKDMEKSSWKDWIQDAENAYSELTGRFKNVYVAGNSMGGLLTLHLAEKYDVQKISTIAAATVMHNRKICFSPILKIFQKYRDNLPFKIRFPDEYKDYLLEYKLNYSKQPIKSINDLNILKNKVNKKLHDINSEILIIQSLKDEAVKPKSANKIFENISSTHKKIVWLKESRHPYTIGPEREIVFDEIIDFFK